MISPPEKETQHGEPRYQELFAQRGLACPPYWWQIVSQSASEGARNVVRLLMHAPADQRPDG